MPSKYKYTRKKVCRKGKLDGRGWRWKFWPFMKEEFPVYPANDQTDLPMYELQLKKAGEDWLTDLAEEWSEKDKKLKTEYCDALVKVQNATADMNLDKAELDEAKQMYDEALEDFREMPQPAFSKIFEWIVIILLAVAEFFFNYMIFSVLGSSKLETMITAATISVALPLSALGFGHTLRIDNKTKVQYIWAVVLVLIPFLVFIAIAFLRAALFEAAWQNSELKLSLTPFQATTAFVVINLLIWLIAAFVSYRAANKDPETYRKMKLRLKDAKKKLEHEGKEYHDAVKTYERTRIQYEQSKHIRKEEFDHVAAKAKDMVKTVKWFISVYRTSNQEVRKDGQIPPCFNAPIHELSIPPDLHESTLDWDCQMADRRQIIQSSNPN